MAQLNARLALAAAAALALLPLGAPALAQNQNKNRSWRTGRSRRRPCSIASRSRISSRATTTTFPWARHTSWPSTSPRMPCWMSTAWSPRATRKSPSCISGRKGAEAPAAKAQYRRGHMLLTNPIINVEGNIATAHLIWTGVMNEGPGKPPSLYEQGREYTELRKVKGQVAHQPPLHHRGQRPAGQIRRHLETPRAPLRRGSTTGCE